VVVIVGTHLLGPEQFGYFALIVFIGEFADVSATNWTRIAISRFGSTQAGVSRAFARKMLLLTSVCLLGALAISGGVAELLAPETSGRVAFAVLYYVFGVTLYRFGFTLHQTVQNRKMASGLEVARAVLVLSAAIVAMMQTGDYFVTSLVSSSAGLAVGLIAVATGLASTRAELKDATSLGTLFAFALPLVILALLSQAISNLDKAMLKLFHDAAMLGISAAAFAIGRTGFDVVATAFNMGAFPRLSAMFNDGQNENAQSLLKGQISLILSVALPAAGILVASREVIAMALFPPAYLYAFTVAIPLIALGSIALNLKNFVFDGVFHMHLKNFMQIPVLLAGACVSAVVGYLFVPWEPFFGSALMFASGGVVALMMDMWLTARIMRIEIPWRSIGFSAGIGMITWVAGSSLVLVGSSLPAWGLLILLGALGAAAIAASLGTAAVAHLGGGTKVAVAFITPDPDKITGLSSYTESLVQAAASRKDAPSLIFLTNANKNILPRLADQQNLEWVQLPARSLVPYKLYSLIAHQIANVRAALRGCSVYVSSTTAGAPLPVTSQFAVLHDLYDLDRTYRPLRTVIYAQLVWRWLGWVCQGIVCVSAATRDDAVASGLFPASRLHVIKEASKFSIDESRRPETAARFLFVANVQPTKNVECLLEALRRSEQEGKALHVDWVGSDPRGIVRAWIEKNGKPSGFRALGPVPDAKLVEAYRMSLALVVPSWKEGFCLPILEAQSFGRPVIASNIPVLREVAGEGALFFDPSHPDDLRNRMNDIENDPALRRRLCTAAFTNNKLYSWERAAGELLSLVQKEARP
jgi:glycosyltransferase involved in cell wall biosynthesis/O-antigen/teichoic acid export membrane protein